jgi:hypothetical protein
LRKHAHNPEINNHLSNLDLNEVRTERVQSNSFRKLMKKTGLQLIFLALIMNISFSTNNTTKSFDYRTNLLSLLQLTKNQETNVIIKIYFI